LRTPGSQTQGPERPDDGWEAAWRRRVDAFIDGDAGVRDEEITPMPLAPPVTTATLLNVASAAGLLMIFDTISYTVTKHASIGLTEGLAATYVDQGIGLSVLCPAAVRTPILAGKEDTPEGRDAISTDELADMVVEGLAEERFMISTHPWVLEKFAVKARD
jgi:NAD(P)-dependent dehydrogenase (short-subunit alcohol dehydrogenase family)